MMEEDVDDGGGCGWWRRMWMMEEDVDDGGGCG